MKKLILIVVMMITLIGCAERNYVTARHDLAKEYVAIEGIQDPILRQQRMEENNRKSQLLNAEKEKRDAAEARMLGAVTTGVLIGQALQPSQPTSGVWFGPNGGGTYHKLQDGSSIIFGPKGAISVY